MFPSNPKCSPIALVKLAGFRYSGAAGRYVLRKQCNFLGQRWFQIYVLFNHINPTNRFNVLVTKSFIVFANKYILKGELLFSSVGLVKLIHVH